MFDTCLSVIRIQFFWNKKDKNEDKVSLFEITAILCSLQGCDADL